MYVSVARWGRAVMRRRWRRRRRVTQRRRGGKVNRAATSTRAGVLLRVKVALCRAPANRFARVVGGRALAVLAIPTVSVRWLPFGVLVVATTTTASYTVLWRRASVRWGDFVSLTV